MDDELVPCEQKSFSVLFRFFLRLRMTIKSEGGRQIASLSFIFNPTATDRLRHHAASAR